MELHQLLATVGRAVAQARMHTECARDLLEQGRRAIVDAQAQAAPWIPVQLAQTIEQLDTQDVRLTGVEELLTGYRARL